MQAGGQRNPMQLKGYLGEGRCSKGVGPVLIRNRILRHLTKSAEAEKNEI